MMWPQYTGSILGKDRLQTYSETCLISYKVDKSGDSPGLLDLMHETGHADV
jgi:hypothetical protein